MCVNVYAQGLEMPEEDIGFLGAGVRDSCDLLSVSAGNQI